MKNKNVINFAIYGCGNVANVHVQSLLEMEDANLVGVADINYERAVAFADKYRVKAFEDLNAVLSSDDIDAVCICTPSGTHADLAIEALRCGKHVVLEKPMALTVSDCDRIIEACRNSEHKLMVISQLRAMPDVQRARSIIQSGALGKITFVEARMKYYRDESYYRGSWRGTKAMDGGGALMNQGVHGVDLLLYLCGGVKRVQSSVRTLIHDIEVEDTAAAICEFESGALGVIEATTSVYPGFNRVFEVCGSEGSLILTEGRLVRVVTKNGKINVDNSVEETNRANDATKLEITGHKNQIGNFVKVLLGDSEREYCDEYQGKNAVALIEEIYKKSM